MCGAAPDSIRIGLPSPYDRSKIGATSPRGHTPDHSPHTINQYPNSLQTRSRARPRPLASVRHTPQPAACLPETQPALTAHTWVMAPNPCASPPQRNVALPILKWCVACEARIDIFFRRMRACPLGPQLKAALRTWRSCSSLLRLRTPLLDRVHSSVEGIVERSEHVAQTHRRNYERPRAGCGGL